MSTHCPASKRAWRGHRRGWFAWGVAVLCLSAGWLGVRRAIELKCMRPVAVPWPQGLRVSEDLRLLTFPAQVGPYSLVPDGEIILGDHLTRILGVSTPGRPQAWAERRSNWYLARVYEDARPDSAFRYWRLLLCYHTGELDIPPPLPDLASTPRLPWRKRSDRFLDSAKLVFRLRTGLPAWEGPTSCCRVRQRRSDMERTWQIAQYDIAILNGEPVDSWGATARREMKITSSKPRYLGRVEVAPWGPVRDWPEADQAAKEFLRHVMPAVLRTMPSADQMDEMRSR